MSNPNPTTEKDPTEDPQSQEPEKSPEPEKENQSPSKPEEAAGQDAGKGAGEGASSEYYEGHAHVRPSDHGPDTTATLEPLTRATPQDWLGSNQDPDVLLAIPNLGIDHIGLTVKNLHAHVDLHAKVLDLLELHVGADVGIEEVKLEINNVRVQAMLKVKLDKVVEVVEDVVELLDHHPEILSGLTVGLGRGLEGALSKGISGDGGQQQSIGAGMPAMPEMPSAQQEQQEQQQRPTASDEESDDEDDDEDVEESDDEENDDEENDDEESEKDDDDE